jgi:cytochrome c-type protein NapB
MSVPDLGFAPANPHRDTEGMGEEVRCRQCHVFRATDEVFVANGFTGLPQDLRPGERFSDGSPPVIPHPVFMRENCVACHTGPGAREEIRTSHPERDRCRQCHVEQTTPGLFTP